MRIGIDTNILVHAYDKKDKKKYEVAKNIIVSCWEGKQTLVTTNQVLAEFALVITKKASCKMPERDVQEVLQHIAQFDNWEIYPYRTQDIQQAVKTKKFWDGLITATLKRHGIKKILTENTKDFPGIECINPFCKSTTKSSKGKR